MLQAKKHTVNAARARPRASGFERCPSVVTPVSGSTAWMVSNPGDDENRTEPRANSVVSPHAPRRSAQCLEAAAVEDVGPPDVLERDAPCVHEPGERERGPEQPRDDRVKLIDDRR